MNNQTPSEAGAAMQVPVETGAAMQSGNQWTNESSAQGATATMPEAGAAMQTPVETGAPMQESNNDDYGLKARTEFNEDQINDPNSRGTTVLTDTSGESASQDSMTASPEATDTIAPAESSDTSSMTAPETGMGDMSTDTAAPASEASVDAGSEAPAAPNSSIVSPDVVPFAGSDAAAPAPESGDTSNSESPAETGMGDISADTNASSDESKPDAEKWTGGNDDSSGQEGESASGEVAHTPASIIAEIQKMQDINDDDRIKIALSALGAPDKE